MSEKKDDVVVEGEVKENVIGAEQIRNHELFQKQARLASELKAKLEAYEAKERDAEEDRQKKLLEEKGNFEALYKLKETELEGRLKEFEKKLLKEKLTNALYSRGVTHPVAVKSALADYDYAQGEEILSEYVESVVGSEEYKIFFQSAPEATGRPGPAPVSPGTTAKSWAQIREDLTSPDAGVRKKADQQVYEFMIKHGKLPWD